jgi:CRISPR/Cas system endoribonuclease Cas6 (RAMP superfamily)
VARIAKEENFKLLTRLEIRQELAFYVYFQKHVDKILGCDVTKLQARSPSTKIHAPSNTLNLQNSPSLQNESIFKEEFYPESGNYLNSLFTPENADEGSFFSKLLELIFQQAQSLNV